jgi:amino acid adenylation domain-containing protein
VPATLIDGCVHELFEAQVARSPEATAVSDRDGSLSYRQLHERANQLAHVLRAAGVDVETIVGVCCERSVDLIVAVLGVLKAGGAYVPLDPDHPRHRLDVIIKDVGLALVVTQRSVESVLAGSSVRRVFVDAGLAASPASTPRTGVGADSAMYALYTSGSTGEPNGVVTTHRAITNRLRWAAQHHPYGAGEVGCARTTLGFVDSVAEIFAPLVSGVPLVVIGSEAQRDPSIMIGELHAAAVTRIVLVPSLLTTLLDLVPDLDARLPSLRWWFLGGEPVPIALVRRFVAAMPGRKLVNLYGATEVSGDATAFDFDDLPDGLTSSPIGTPLPGVWARIVDEELREVPDGEAGEVVVSGLCLARGYLNRPAMTTDRFVENPFPEGGRLYRMGDLGRRLPRGEIEYLGRTDQQVKIRGMRVELGAIEALIAAAPGIRQAVAVAPEDSSGRRILVVFYTADRAVPASVVRAHASGQVPAYMVPSHCVQLDAFPINANGKIDRRALRDREVRVALDGAPPANDDERRIARVWEAVLACGSIGRTQSFHELGGNSLAAMRIAMGLHDELGVRIPASALFTHPTVAAIAAHVAGALRAAPRRAITASRKPIPGVLPLAHAQVAYWFFRALTGEVSIVSECFGFSEPVDVERLQRAYARTVARFDALWMRFPRWRPIQRITPRRAVRFAISDHRDQPDGDLLQRAADANNTTAFALEAPPHVHARLVRLRSGDHLLVAIPHVCGDMVALDLFRRALELGYQDHPVPAPSTSLADLVAWERGASQGELEHDARYWSSIAPGPAWNTLPDRLFAGKLAGRRARAFSQQDVPAELTTCVERYGRMRGVSFAAVAVGAVHAAVARVGGRAPTLLVVLDNRGRPETRDLFTTLASMIRCRVPRCGSLDELVARVGQQLIASCEHADHVMRRPTWFNNFWADAPRPLVGLVNRFAAAAARRWPEAQLDTDALAQYVFAIVPFPRRAARQGRDIVIAVNLLPEVSGPAPPRDGGFHIAPARRLPLLLKPGDFVVNTDRLLDRTLEIVFARNARGLIEVNLYGGGIDQAGLDELNAGILAVLRELAASLPAR